MSGRQIKFEILNKNTAIIFFLGNEARATKNSITAAISSMFRGGGSNSGKKSTTNSPINENNRQSSSSLSTSSNTSSLPTILTYEFSKFNAEVRRYALAAVILEEWLQELAAIAQEQSVLMKEVAFQLGMAIDETKTSESNPAVKNASTTTKTSAILENHQVLLETSKS